MVVEIRGAVQTTWMTKDKALARWKLSETKEARAPESVFSALL